MKRKCPKCGQWCDENKSERMSEFIFTTERVIGGSLGNMMSDIAKSTIGPVYKFQCPKCGNKFGSNYESDDQTFEYELEQLESEENNSQQEHKQEIISLRDQSLQLSSYSSHEAEEFEEQLASELSEEDDDECIACLYNVMAYIKHKSGDKIGALDAINKSIQYLDAPDAHATKGVIMAMGENRTAFDKYKALQELVKYKEEDGIPYWATNSEMDNLIEEQTLSFANDFLNIPYRQRKFIVISDQDYVMLPDNLKVVPWKYLPTEMQFSEGHPVVGEVYVCHPYKETYYLPLDTYQIELFRDELSELRYLLQCLGAKSIEIEDRNRNEESATSAKNMGGHVRAEYKGIGGGVNGSHSNEQETFQTAVNDCLVSQSFSKPKEKAHVPEDLVWYPHRKSWQDLVRQLKMGNVDSHHVTVSTSDCSQVSAKESSSLEIEVNALVAAGGIGGNYDTSSMFKSETNKSWTLKVDFYPYEEEKTPLVKQETSQLFAAPNNAIGNQTRWLIYGLVALIVILGAIIAFLAL